MLRAHVEDHRAIFGGLKYRGGIEVRHLAVTLHRVVLAQGMSFPIFRHHDAAQVRMSYKTHSKQIEDLALEEIHPRPEPHKRFNTRISARQFGDQPYTLFSRMRKQVIDHFKTW